MTAVFKYDLFNILLDIFNTTYPEHDCVIEFVQGMHDKEQAYGCTDYGDPIIVSIDASLAVSDAIEIIAHELAHVVAGYHARHSDKWENVFTDINITFNAYMANKLK